MWLYHQYGPGQEAELASVRLTIPLADIYKLTDIPKQEGEEESE